MPQDHPARVLVDVREPGPVSTGDTSLEYIHRLPVDAVTIASEADYRHVYASLADLQGQVARHNLFLLELASLRRAGANTDEIDTDRLASLIEFVARLGVGLANTIHVLENARSELTRTMPDA